jgi:hypothetical protein
LKVVLLLVLLLASCAWMESYTAGDIARTLTPNRVSWGYSWGEDEFTGWHDGVGTDTEAFHVGLEWDLLAQPVRIESFGQVRAQSLSLPVGDPEVLEAVLSIKEQLDAVEEDADAMAGELRAIHDEVDAEEFLDLLWVKLGVGGGGLTITTLLLLLARSKMGQKATSTPEPEETEA